MLALNDLGMTHYTWVLYFLCGIGWLFDNLWIQGIAEMLPIIAREFGMSNGNVRWVTFSLFIGLAIGTTVFGGSADYVGRRWQFRICPLFAGLCGVALGVQSAFPRTCVCSALVVCRAPIRTRSVLTMVGLFHRRSTQNPTYCMLELTHEQNITVDGALLLEFLPESHKRLLTMLSMFWPIGAGLSSGLAWAIFGRCGWKAYAGSLAGVALPVYIDRASLSW
jgi:MFS family permease